MATGHTPPARWMWLGLLLVALALPGSPERAGGRAETSAETPLDVWAVDSLTRVRPTDPPPPGKAGAGLQAARNEYEAVQVILRARASLRQVSATVTDLTGPGARRIGQEHIELFREHYVRVSRPSPKSPFAPGWWPDALIPFRDPESRRALPGGRFAAGTFDLGPGQTQPLWVEVYVPPDAAAGAYAGTIRITVEGRPVAALPLTLTVWDFVLPRVPSARSYFGDVSRIASLLRLTPGTPEYLRVVGRYEDILIRHRLMPDFPVATVPSVGPDGAVDVQKLRPAMARYMEGVGINSWRLPFWPDDWPFPDTLGKDRERTKRYLREVFTFMVANGWGNRVYIFPVDEPNAPQQYERVRALAALAREAHPGIKLLLTEAPRPHRPRWGELVGSVQIWVVLFSEFDEAQVARRLAAGEEVWSYTALVQGDRPVPHWQLDFPLLNYRIPLWTNWRYGLTGIVYWTTVNWKETGDPWVNPLSIYGAYNGEGILLYPGTAVGYDGPVPTMRLKALRDGMEDYEYLRLLADAGDRAFADAVARRIAPSWSQWEKEPARLLRAREELAARILGLRAGNPRNP